LPQYIIAFLRRSGPAVADGSAGSQTFGRLTAMNAPPGPAAALPIPSPCSWRTTS